MPAKRFLALDIGASTLKAGEFTSSGSGNLTLVNFGKVALEVDPASEEDRSPHIIAALKKLIKERQFKARHAAISVSGQTVLTKFMKLPATEESKIRQMVRYEAAQNVPFPIEEVVWSHQVVGGMDKGELEVILVAIKSDIIESLNNSAEQAGLDVEVVDVAPIALYNAALYNYEAELNSQSTLLLDIGARTTNLIFIEKGKVFIRSIPIAGNSITQNIAQEFEVPFAEGEDLKLKEGFVGLGGVYAEPESPTAARLSKIIRNVMTRMHAEVARSINFYKNQQGGTPPKKLLISGGTSIISYADYFFKEKMEIEVEYFNPFKNVLLQVPVEELEKTAHSMGEVVGLGLRLVTECPIEVNLLPTAIAKRRQLVKKIPYFIYSMVGIVCIILSAWLFEFKRTSLYAAQRDLLEKQNKDFGSVKQKLDEALKLQKTKISEAQQLQKIVQARYQWAQILNDLNKRIPPQMWITQLIPVTSAFQPVDLAGWRMGGGSVRKPGQPGNNNSRGPQRGLQGGASKDPKAQEVVNEITHFEIRGLCLNRPLYSNDPKKPSQPTVPLITDFVANMKENPQFFDEKDIDFIETNVPDASDSTWDFYIRIKLKTPVSY